ncbi:MAG TPA: hypothetical protein VKS82_15115 [Streptosporangiaceae bacterium]|jgi:hypothetical protein|nr:hypothetical protein [Streptosporangiaceae bacterium]
MPAHVLAVIDHDCPGTEDMHDPLYFCVGLRLQFGGIDLVLRGPAVSSALVAADGPAPPEGNGARLPNPQRYVRSLVRAGVRVWVDDADLAGLRRDGQVLIDGVRTADTDAMAARWNEYEEVWFL